MRKVKIGLYSLIAVIFLFFAVKLIWYSTENWRAKNWSGTAHIVLEPNLKLINVTWKDESIWYLVRKMHSDEIAETYYFDEKTPLGMLPGGRVEVVEVKK